MSGSIFFLALFVVVATLSLAGVFDSYIDDKHKRRYAVIMTSCIGTAIALPIFAMSTLFTSVKHIYACIKYDHVVVYDVRKFDMPQIDKEKIIYRDDYVGMVDHGFSYIITAWNDEDMKNVSYDDLVKQH